MKPVALAFAALMLSLPTIAVAAPVVFEASGASPSDILATVNAFRTFLGANNGVGGSFPDGRREINWDGVPDAFAPLRLSSALQHLQPPATLHCAGQHDHRSPLLCAPHS